MIYLGNFKAGDTVFYAANFHNDTGTIENPTSPETQLRNSAGTWSALTAPAQQNSKTGHYGGTIDTTGYSVGQHIIRMAGTVATAKTVATEFCFSIVANTESDTYAIVNHVTYGNSAIETLVDDIESRLTAARAGYLDNLSVGAVAQASVCTESRLAELDAANLITDVANVKTDSAAILDDTGTNGVVVVAASKTGYTLSTAGIDAILDEVCETAGSYTLRQVVSIILSVLAGVTSNNGATLKTPDGTTTRVAATIDANNNRTAMTLTP